MAGQVQGDGAHWSSRAVFILAAIGSAVGLGNLWRFPYVAGENGGGAFVIVYIICVILIGLPVLAAELFIGRRGGGSAVGSVVRLARAEGRSPIWALQGWVGMLGAFIILTFYSVIAGWVIAYALMIGGDLFGAIGRDGLAGLSAGAFSGQTPDQVSAKLGELLSNPTRMIIYHALFMILTVGIVMRGLKGGIESTVTILMPAFFVMLIILVGFSLVQGDQRQGLDFLLGIRLNDVTLDDGTVRHGLFYGLKNGSVISAALGQAFFSIGLGSALMLTYGAYMTKDQNIPKASRLIGIADTGVGILAGVAIFPIVFQVGLNPAAGPTLMFQTLPLAFQQMPFGGVFGLAFFLLAIFAAVTSSIALLEVSTAWFNEQSARDNRGKSAIVLGLIAFVIGVGNALSQVPAGENGENANLFNTWMPGNGIPLFEGMTLLDFLSATTDIMLPIAGFITALFAGWVVSAAASREELGFVSEAWYQRWRFLIRWVCPIGIAAVIVYGLVIPLL